MPGNIKSNSSPFSLADCIVNVSFPLYHDFSLSGLISSCYNLFNWPLDLCCVIKHLNSDVLRIDACRFLRIALITSYNRKMERVGIKLPLTNSLFSSDHSAKGCMPIWYHLFTFLIELIHSLTLMVNCVSVEGLLRSSANPNNVLHRDITVTGN